MTGGFGRTEDRVEHCAALAWITSIFDYFEHAIKASVGFVA